MKWALYFLIGFLVFPGLEVRGQFSDKSFVHITSRDGLMNDEVRAIHQDESGFIWIGTSDGLSQYDGHQFINYFGNDFDTLDRASVWVNFIYELHDNAIRDQANIYNPYLGVFSGHNFDFYNNKRADIVDLVPQIEEAYQLKTRKDNGPIRFAATDFPYSCIPGKSASTWMYTPSGILRWYPEIEKVDTFLLPSDHAGKNEVVILLLEDLEGHLWFQGGSGIARLNPVTKKISLIYEEVFLIKPNNQSNGERDFNGYGPSARKKILCARNGEVWLGHDGIRIFKPGSGQKEHYEQDPFSLTSLSSNKINCLMEDKQGRIWIGTNGKGIDIWDPYRPNVTNFQHNPEDPNSLATNILRSAAEIPGKGILLGAPNRPIIYFD